MTLMIPHRRPFAASRSAVTASPAPIARAALCEARSAGIPVGQNRIIAAMTQPTGAVARGRREPVPESVVGAARGRRAGAALGMGSVAMIPPDGSAVPAHGRPPAWEWPLRTGALRRWPDAVRTRVTVTVRVSAGALVDGDRVLLGHRSPTRRWYPDVWDLPGGHLEPGETSRDALDRELREELGVTVRSAHPLQEVRIVDDVLDQVVVLDVWVVTDWSGTPVNRLPEEHDALAWFTVDDLPTDQLAHPELAVVVRDAVGSGSARGVPGPVGEDGPSRRAACEDGPYGGPTFVHLLGRRCAHGRSSAP